MEDETILCVDEHMRMIEFVLTLFNKSTETLVALIGYNSSTNKDLAIKTGRGFVGCASHLFNLAVQDIIAEYIVLVYCVLKRIKKLRNLILSAKLREHTPLTPLLNKSTRWSSTFHRF